MPSAKEVLLDLLYAVAIAWGLFNLYAVIWSWRLSRGSRHHEKPSSRFDEAMVKSGATSGLPGAP